jgi:hypothetical protein
VDLLVVDSEGAPLLLHNESPQAHYLTLVLNGSKSNRDGIGAKITVKMGERTVYRHCATDGSYMSASDKRVHVGLGTVAQADSVTVTWPDGTTKTLSNVQANQILIIRQ